MLGGMLGFVLSVLVLQVLLTVGFTIWAVFRSMGGDYEAAVICSGFAGIALGSTANMTAVTHSHGTPPLPCCLHQFALSRPRRPRRGVNACPINEAQRESCHPFSSAVRSSFDMLRMNGQQAWCSHISRWHETAEGCTGAVCAAADTQLSPLHHAPVISRANNA